MKKIFTLLAFSIVILNAFSQNNRLSVLSYVFPEDSLSGFNQEEKKNEALGNGFFGTEHDIFMYQSKREFINKKYSLTAPVSNLDNPALNKVNNAPCVNEDFEASPVGPVAGVNGWIMLQGINSGPNSSCYMTGCCTTTASGLNSWIRTTPISLVSHSMTLPHSPLGGTKVIQLNDSVKNVGEIMRIQQTFPVTSTNYILEYAYWCALDASAHSCCSNPYLNILLYDCSNNIISSASASVAAPALQCPVTLPNWVYTGTGRGNFTGWQVKTVNLSTYIGSCVRIQVTVGDCQGWEHAGYCFFDAKCSAGTSIEDEKYKTTTTKVFPNPSNGIFQIIGAEDELITISNELGQVVKQVTLTSSNNFSAYINDLSEGLYFVNGNHIKEKIVILDK